MRRILWAIPAVIAAAAPAGAADLGAYRAPGYAPAYAPAWTWTGFYIGANLGGGWAHGTVTDSTTGLGSTTASEDLTGLIGGAQIGYNYQLGQLVLGVEADIDGSGENVTNNYSCGALIAGCLATDSAHVNAFGTVRGRIGFALDRLLIYGTGGFSWQNASSTFSVTVPGLGTGSAPVSTTRTGYALGAGLETALWGNWIAGAEYLYLDTGTWTEGSFGLGGLTTSQTLRLQNNILRGRLSYKF